MIQTLISKKRHILYQNVLTDNLNVSKMLIKCLEADYCQVSISKFF